MLYTTLMQGLRGAAAALVIAASATPPLGAQPVGSGRYSVDEYARLDDPGESPVIRRINVREEIAAGLTPRGDRRGVPRALVLTAEGVIEIPSLRGRDFSASYGLNDEGEVTGAFNAEFALRPFRSLQRSAFVALPVLPDHSGGIAYAINARGEAVGYSSGAEGVRAVWWTRSGQIQALPSEPGADSRALAVNNRGDVVGSTGEQPPRAVMWPAKGEAVDLGTLSGFGGSEALSTNDRGDVVGNALGVEGAPDRSRAVLWAAGKGGLQDLGTLPGDSDSRAQDINARGEVVGSSSGPTGDRAFLWRAQSGMVDLNTLASLPGLVLVEALGINQNGAILAIAQETDDHAPGEAGEHGDHELPRRIVVLRPQR